MSEAVSNLSPGMRNALAQLLRGGGAVVTQAAFAIDLPDLGGAQRLREAGITDITLLEKRETVGGTWRDNRYPGAACDVPSHLYSYSFKLKSDWSRVFAPATEIWEYIRWCARDENVMSHIHFNTDRRFVW